MKKVLVSGLFLSVAAFAETWSGTISDAHCGAKHVASSEADQKCVAGCTKRGEAPVFVVGDKVIAIENPEAVKGHEGHKVTITGSMKGEAVHVDSVKM